MRFLHRVTPQVSFVIAGLLVPGAQVMAQEGPESPELRNSGQNCTFIAAPDEFMSRESRARRAAYDRALAFNRLKSERRAAATPRAASPDSLPVRNFIDEEIFNKLRASGGQAAALSSDEEFLRRIYLDLTGRIPSAAEIRAFVADTRPDKRDVMIERLLYGPEFIDKWTMWLGDILGNALAAQNRSQQLEGRNSLHDWIRGSIAHGKSWRDIAFEVVAAQGNNYDRDTAGANFVLRGFAPMGPAQDTYDLMMVRAATTFLGLGHYDCLSCHNGKYHLDAVSVWGANVLRQEAQQMSAHFARVTIQGYPGNDPANFYTNSTNILERTTGTYDLNTTFGNRPNRTAATINGKPVVNLMPVYRDGTPASGTAWRESFVRAMINDPMFARNYANRLWKAMFNLALAEPVDLLDPARLDPKVEPPQGWTHQASHPVLLEKLAELSKTYDYNLREILRFIAQSSAYQLSSRYDGEWDMTKASLFLRRIPRRLEAEEVHDAITKSTGLLPSYTVGGWGDRATWAMQLPEPTEPRSDGTALNFMNSFNRGNRDTIQRSQSGSILMWLNMMNSAFVNNRIKAQGTGASPYLVSMVAIKDDDTVVEDMFLTFLSRRPTEYEKGVAVRTLKKTTTAQYTRAAAVEDLAWALTNKVDFLFSY